MKKIVLATAVFAAHALAAVTGSITGTVKDPSGAVIPGVTITATNAAQGVQTKVTSDPRGSYTFPSLPVGQYNLKAETTGFKPEARQNIAVDLDAVVQIDLTLELAEKIEEVTVSET